MFNIIVLIIHTLYLYYVIRLQAKNRKLESDLSQAGIARGIFLLLSCLYCIPIVLTCLHTLIYTLYMYI